MNLNPMPGVACGINLAYKFLPEVLAGAGYKSYALGKWHLGFQNNSYTPTYRGFHSYLGYYSGAEEHFTHLKAGEVRDQPCASACRPAPQSEPPAFRHTAALTR